MRPRARRILTVASVAGGALALGRWRARGPDRGGRGDGDGHRWQVVTINRPPDEVAPDGRVPDPLGKLGDAVEVEVRRAPGDRGTELAARPRADAPALSDEDPRRAVRRALRNTKQLIEAGEILGPHQPPTTRRTLMGLPLELVTRRARREGRL
jgi:hypothetical protein